VAALTVALARAGGAGRAVNLRDAAFGALVAAFPNTGFMGMPLLTALLGAAAAAPRRATSRCRTDHPRLRRPGLLQLLRAGDLVWCKFGLIRPGMAHNVASAHHFPRRF